MSRGRWKPEPRVPLESLFLQHTPTFRFKIAGFQLADFHSSRTPRLISLNHLQFLPPRLIILFGTSRFFYVD